MKTSLQCLICLALISVVLSLSGCASGSARGPVTEASMEAPIQVAAALFVQQWSQILWGAGGGQTGGPPSSGQPVSDPVNMTVSITFTWPDGTVGVLTQFLADGTLVLELTFPDQSTQTIKQGVLQSDGVSKSTIAWEIATSAGMKVAYTSVVDNRGTISNMSDDTTDLTGDATLPRGLSQHFGVKTANAETAVESTQSDGSVFTMNVRLAPPLNSYPDMSQTSTGTYRLGGNSMIFDLVSTPASPKRWGAMASNFGDELTGQFSLNQDFSGSGELRRRGDLAGKLSWTRGGEMSLTLVSAERALVNPAGAAVDFLTHRWQTLTALLSPAPG